MVKNLPASVGDIGLTAGSGRFPVPRSRLENLMDRGVWQAIIHEVTKSQTRLSN